VKISCFLRFITVFSISCILHIAAAEKANAVNEYLKSGFSPASAQNLKWTTDSSVSTVYEQAYIQPSYNAWNGISSKTNFSKGTSTDYKVKYFVAGSPIASRVGIIIPYCTGGSGTACAEVAAGGSALIPVVWTAAQLYLYESNMVALGYDRAKRITAASHEVGHVFSMSHNPASGLAAPANIPSLMGGVIGPNSTLSLFDRINFQQKWGQ
jgi:hypothetical protein